MTVVTQFNIGDRLRHVYPDGKVAPYTFKVGEINVSTIPGRPELILIRYRAIYVSKSESYSAPQYRAGKWFAESEVKAAG